jgi:hypothetical protein
MSKLSSSIQSQLSGTIRQSHPRFVEFLRAYYEWLENPDNAYYHIRNHLSFLDFENSLDSYVSQMKKEYLVNIPESILGNPEQFIKYSKQLNLSIGSQKSFNFVFNMLYGEDVEIYFPKDDILRGSDGKWVDNEYKLFITNSFSSDRFLNKRIVQKKAISSNVFEISYGTVLRVKNRFAGRYKFSELVITDLVGEFDFSSPVFLEGDDTKQEWFMPVGSDYTINLEGINYRQGDLVKLPPTTDKYVIQRQAKTSGRFDTRVTSDFNKADIEFYVNGTLIPNNQYLFDGRTVLSNVIAAGSDVEIRLPVYNGFMVVDQVGGSLGNIQSLNIIDPPIGINGILYQLDTTEGGSGADIDIKQGTTLIIPGYYRNDDGHLSSTKVLQDGEYYQEYSYVIRSSQNIDAYRDIVMEVLHPAGMKMFGQINIKFLIDLMIRNIDFNINIRPPVQIIVSQSSLGPTTSFLDRMKNTWSSDFVLVSDYIDRVTGDIIDTPLKRDNIADFEYSQRACVDQYTTPSYYVPGYVCEGVNDIVDCIDDYIDPSYYVYGYVCDQVV